ncbi:type IV toxin-antitoxin system AbiEi family antitoxin domain-containing protein [Arthrobacter sp.]|uniref:type IV toxin-antitoxin system AbiEi family antitoxin domain-containing protein n=1 Tax=Arthrobacter sp. TaxID=1667 RepID=UPI002583F155|nr:type IV toxin-antitoxin system AbiEi family antitoxin domain-containing protein [Arthrobacter sp.]
MNKPRLILPADLRLVGQDSRRLAQLENKGELVRIRRGVYTKSADWNNSSPSQRYGLQAAAFQALAARRPVLCHATAARLWGLWIVGLPSKLHVVTDVATSGRNNNGVMRHLGSLTNGIVQCGPFLLIDKLTTTMALVKELAFPYAVAVCDSALRKPEGRQAVNRFTAAGYVPDAREPSWGTDGPQGPAVSADELRAAAGRLTSRAARERTLAVINFASALSGSAGESLSRAKMLQLGVPAPVLQQPFILRDGREAKVDFWFEERRLVGEFDGKGKYLRADWGKGKSIQDRVLAEKAREDQIRAHGVGFVRWTWAEMMSRERFVRLLLQAGLPQK